VQKKRKISRGPDLWSFTGVDHKQEVRKPLKFLNIDLDLRV
jgi:hypothetical protein